MPDAPDSADDADRELIPRLRVIEEQPLADRAEAYLALSDELARRLESGPSLDGGARG
ncbi:hypothetical protein ACTU3I_10270 [Microbacterium sp. RD1]|uniref:hypothetical protein n=1 Tax=Microbacterium sp. RD1 TaxID=3457313 RepID=UPI003FA57752